MAAIAMRTSIDCEPVTAPRIPEKLSRAEEPPPCHNILGTVLRLRLRRQAHAQARRHLATDCERTRRCQALTRPAQCPQGAPRCRRFVHQFEILYVGLTGMGGGAH